MKLQSNKWYKATPSYPTPRTVYVQQVKDAVNNGGLYMVIEHGYCQFHVQLGYFAFELPPIYSCTRETGKRKFKFEEI